MFLHRLHWLLVVGALACGPAVAQGFADEDRDWGIAPIEELRRPPYSAPTPRSIPDGSVITTAELRDRLAGANPPVVIDVAGGEGHETLPGALWIPGAGRGDNFVDPVQAQFAALLGQVTAGDKGRGLVFLCVNAQCWLSYNAARRAIAAGFRQVYWYRGGYAAWRAAGLPLVPMQPPGSAGASSAAPIKEPARSSTMRPADRAAPVR